MLFSFNLSVSHLTSGIGVIKGIMKAAQPKLIVTLVRHGETSMNVQRVMQGHCDTPLSEVGIEQATKLGKHLKGNIKFTKAFASDLQRAHNTATLILNEVDNDAPTVVKDVKLRERCFGEFEGRPAKEFLDAAKAANISANEFIPKGAETLEEIRDRAAEFFLELCESSKSLSEDENVLVASHGGLIHCFMRYLNDSNKVYRLKNFSAKEAIRIHENTAVTVMHITPDACKTDSKKYEVEFVKVNNVDHLK